MKKMVIIASLILLVLVLCLIIYKINNKQQDIKFNNEKLQITNFNISNRVTLIVDDAIYVGNNQKELENNFYDIKILNTANGVALYLNKLWYETYGDDYIQDEYLARICRELVTRLNVEGDAEQLEYLLYKYVKDNYIKVRQNEEVEDIITDNIKLKFELEDSIVKLIIN